MFNYDIHQTKTQHTATADIDDEKLNNFVNVEGDCAGIFHYLFLSRGE